MKVCQLYLTAHFVIRAESFIGWSLHVSMNNALEKWSEEAFKLDSLPSQPLVFGDMFACQSNAAMSYFLSNDCNQEVTTCFKELSVKSNQALKRQLSDFLPEGKLFSSLGSKSDIAIS